MDSTKINALMQYIARGWALVPLHDVAHVAAECSCGAGAYPIHKSAGKHPRAKEWQRPENLVTTPEALERWPASCNWGLATGLVSGVWALDYDPQAVTDPQAAGAVLALLAGVPTWQQRTGSGGAHWLFTLPEDFIPNNSSKRLPAGFDVRGARAGEVSGGQIVLAPSVSGVGPYGVLQDGDVLAAPAALLDLVRPTPPRRQPTTLVFSAPAQNVITSYAIKGVAGELEALRSTATSRNNRAYQAAVRIIELANGAGLHRDHVYAAWWAAAAAHPDPAVRVPDRELLSVWSSAERRVGDRPADLSGVGGPSGWGGDRIPFSAAPGAAPGLGQAGSGSTGPRPGDPVAGQGGTAADIAGQGRDSGQIGPMIDPVDALLAEMLDIEALRNIVPPQPLINGVLDLDTTAWLIGASGSYKSFVALDLAAHVGLGRPWRGHDVTQGEVVYIVAEGARGMRLRVDAWEREHGPMKGIRFLPRPVQAGSEPAWGVLVAACSRLRPSLVIIDTQARVTLGLEENSNTDMGRYVGAVDAIRTATGACVLTVHHTGRDGKDARGASALDGAQDAELKIEKVGMFSIKLVMDKQKDQAQDAPMPIRLKRSDGGVDPVTGRDLSSLVVDHAEAPPLGEPGSAQDIGHRRALALFQVIYGLLPSGGEGLQRSEIRALFYAIPEIADLSGPEARRKAWVRAWAFLLQRGRVMRYGTSQRFAVFPPPDGGPDGMLTANDGSPADMPPDGWSTMTVAGDQE
jgi:hypothetical protein